jgi:hypothetical protein
MGIDPPGNGKVSNADLYKALYDLDKGLGERFTAISRETAALQEGINLCREELAEHKKDHQAVTPKMGGLAGLVAVFVAALVSALGDLVKR